MTAESSPLRITDDTELIEISQGKFKFINSQFKKPGHKMYDFQCDVKLRTNGRVYQAHRDVLSEASGYFSAMFSSNFREKDQDVIELHDLPPIGFDSLLEYFYRGHINITDDNIGEVVEAARFFQNDWLLSACMIFLVQYFIYGKDEEALALADAYDLGDLWEPAFTFLEANFGSIMQDKGFNRISFKVLMEFLRGDHFVGATESDVLRSLIEHWDAQPERLRCLLGTLRLQLLSVEDIQLLRDAAGLGSSDGASAEEAAKSANDAQPAEEAKDGGKEEKEADKEEDTESKRAMDQLAQRLQALQCAADDANVNFASCRPRGARPTLLIISTMDHVTVVQYVRVETSRLAMCIEMDTSGRLPVSPEDAHVANLGPHLMLFTGGYDLEFSSSTVSLAFDPSALTWTSLAPMECGRVSHAMASTDSTDPTERSLVLAVGGVRRSRDQKSNADIEEILTSVEVFDRLRWRPLTSLPTGLFSHAAACLDGYLYVSGGISDDPSDSIPMNRLRRLRLPSAEGSDEKAQENSGDSSAWETLPDMSCSRQQHVMFGYGGRLFVFGGTTVELGDPEEQMFGEPVPCLVNEVYDPVQQLWSDLTPTPAEFGRIFSPFAVAGDRVYVCSGDETNKYLRTFHLPTCEWTSVRGEDGETEQRVGDVCTHMAYLEVAVRD